MLEISNVFCKQLRLFEAADFILQANIRLRKGEEDEEGGRKIIKKERAVSATNWQLFILIDKSILINEADIEYEGYVQLFVILHNLNFSFHLCIYFLLFKCMYV